MSNDYDKLAARAERGDLSAKPGTVRRGEESRNEARKAFLNATRANNLDEANALILDDTELRQEIATRVAADGPTSPRLPRRARQNDIG